jgi:hypothetical protein
MPSKNHQGRWGINTTRGGEPPIGGKVALIEEAKKNLMAVINRLHRHEQYDLAEEIFDIVTSQR